MAVKKRENTFEQLNRVDVSKFAEKKGQFTYLRWAGAVRELLKGDPEATWEIAKDKKVPKYVMAAINYQVMHETLPSYLTQFYGKQTTISDTDGERGGFAEAVPG